MIRMMVPLFLLVLVGAGCSQGGPGAGQDTNAADNAQAPAAAPKAPEPLPDIVRVRLDTEVGAITLALDAKHAPVTTANFVRYVDEHRFDGTSFYRAARTKGNEKEGFIQGGIRRDYRRMLPPIRHEPTSETGLRHVTGAISMARSDVAGVGAMGEFFIVTHPMPDMDANGGKPGYAVFGKVVDGMAIVRKILAAPTFPGGSGTMKGQLIEKPLKIVKAERVG